MVNDRVGKNRTGLMCRVTARESRRVVEHREREAVISLSTNSSPGELSGKFRFIAEIGHGGMSEVYLALSQGGLGGFQKLVAIKLLRRDLAKDEDFRRMFLEEAR